MSEAAHFPIGTQLKYRLSDGSDVPITISSERLRHENGSWGWEAMFHDDGQTGFAEESRISPQ